MRRFALATVCVTLLKESAVVMRAGMVLVANLKSVVTIAQGTDLASNILVSAAARWVTMAPHAHSSSAQATVVALEAAAIVCQGCVCADQASQVLNVSRPQLVRRSKQHTRNGRFGKRDGPSVRMAG